ncbi:DNA primase [Moorella sp. E308F]|jgi:DNA primase|uniref:DNA primase n=1 Tax=Moorella sp. E308F TaxID=2572682 RepID=UPI0010FFAE87|nr:DNA primase [Moorella sp. E308F]GEA16510.1 DNA primase [Moorella sp. E308F]
MTAAFSQEVIDEVKDRVDIVEIIGSYVRLKKSGRNYVGLCPFHKEKTPSFTVSPDKQMFYCFGCGAGGDVLAFLMKQDGLSFPEAVKTLAARVGIDLAGAEESPAAKRQREWKERLYQLGAIAASFYYRLLMRHPVGAAARLYLQQRGVKGETARLFELGYAPDTGTALVDYLRRQGFTPRDIDQAGLSASRPPLGTADRFRGRLMFPIKDSRGRVIGFGGRTLSGGQPKYLNSPETVLFHKGRHLYGLHLALPGIRRKGQAILVEGYMDMIAAWQHGIDNVVASLGTALTPEQARELKKYAREVIIAYDADSAGEAATLRGLDILAAAGLQVRVLQLPEGKDPDEFLAARGAAAFQELVETSQSLMEFRINKAVAAHDPTRPLGRKAIMAAVLPSLQQVKDVVEQEAYVRLLSRHTGISEAAILKALSQPPARHGRTGKAIEKAGRKEDPAPGKRAGNPGELFLLQAYLSSPGLAAGIDGELGEDWGDSPAIQSLTAFVREKRREAPELAGPSLARVLTGRGVPEWDALIARLTLADGLGPVQEQAVKKAILLYKLQRLQKQEREIRIALARAENSGATGRVQELQEQIFHLQQTIKAIKSGRGE